MMRSLSLAWAVFLMVPGGAWAVHDSELVFRVGKSGQLTLRELAGELEGVRVITIGEQHDNLAHHLAQLRVIEALHESGREIAIGFEQFGVRSQETLDRWISGSASLEELFRTYSTDWELNWWPLYFPIFQYAREHAIPMIGLNVPREIVRQVAQRGFSSLSPQQRGEIKVLSCNIDQRYQDALARILGRKGKKRTPEMFQRFCEAQVVWDTAMALNTLNYLEDHPDTSMVVLAGNFHAWKRGIPEQISRMSDIPVKAILPSEDSTFFNYEVVLEDADYVWWFR